MSGEYSDAERAATRAWLDAMPPAEACSMIEDAIGQAMHDRVLDAVPALLVLMCRYDPDRAERLRRAMLDATQGRITIMLEGLR